MPKRTAQHQGPMIHLAMPLGTNYGWGIAGRMIALELSRRAEVRLYTDLVDERLVPDEFELRALRDLLPAAADPLKPTPAGKVDGPVLRGIDSVLGRSSFPELRGSFTVGYTFVEFDLILQANRAALREFDHIVGGSTWCAEVLKAAGHPSVSVIIQGIDPRLFNDRDHDKEYLRDEFVVFSGSKLEFRKGQDVVIRAVAVLQQRHPDVFFVNAWHNPWPRTVQSISQSRHIKVPQFQGEYFQFVRKLLEHNGLDVNRVLVLGPRPNGMMAAVYKNSDVGIFLSRCEGGTNMVLGEYMACGKPAIASFHTGHMDVLSDANSLPVRSFTPFDARSPDQKVIGRWYEPNLDEVIERLEYAYQNRQKLRSLGDRAASDMAQLTWAKTAEKFHDLLLKENKMDAPENISASTP